MQSVYLYDMVDHCARKLKDQANLTLCLKVVLLDEEELAESVSSEGKAKSVSGKRTRSDYPSTKSVLQKNKRSSREGSKGELHPVVA